MRTLTARATQAEDLYFIRHQLDWLSEHRRNVGFSPEDKVEYHRLLTSEEELLHLVGV
jgi:hypothetical protein